MRMMPTNGAAAWLVAIAAAGMVAAAAVSVHAGQTRTVLEGTYTAAQADRGKDAYLKDCATCHADNLQGGDEAPGLTGGGFLAQWVDLSVGDLFERTRLTMPQDRPGAVSRAALADILAYVFKQNGFPAGDAELPADTAALKTITIVQPPPK